MASAPDLKEKSVPAVQIVSLRKEVPWKGFQQHLTATYIQLLEFLKEKNVAAAGKMLTLTYSANDATIDVEVAVPVASSAALGAAKPPVQIRTLSAGTALFVTFSGSYEPVFESYSTLPVAVQARGKTLREPLRTLYLVSPADTANAAAYTTEVQAIV